MRQWSNRYYYRPERLVLLATRSDAGADEWLAAPDPLDELGSAEARNTVSPQQRGTSFAGETPGDESAAGMDWLVAFTGREVACI